MILWCPPLIKISTLEVRWRHTHQLLKPELINLKAGNHLICCEPTTIKTVKEQCSAVKRVVTWQNNFAEGSVFLRTIFWTQMMGELAPVARGNRLTMHTPRPGYTLKILWTLKVSMCTGSYQIVGNLYLIVLLEHSPRCLLGNDGHVGESDCGDEKYKMRCIRFLTIWHSLICQSGVLVSMNITGIWYEGMSMTSEHQPIWCGNKQNQTMLQNKSFVRLSQGLSWLGVLRSRDTFP